MALAYILCDVCSREESLMRVHEKTMMHSKALHIACVYAVSKQVDKQDTSSFLSNE